MIKCVNCKNRTYVPKTMVKRHKIKNSLCGNCATKIQNKFKKLSEKEITRFASSYKNGKFL